MTKTLKIIVLVILIIGGYNLAKTYLARNFMKPTQSPIPTGITSANQEVVKEDGPTSTEKNIEVVAENLKIPWELVFLPSGEMLITERAGNLVKIDKDKKIINIEGVYHVGEGGLLGLTLDPKFKDSKYLYLYLTAREGGKTVNRVEKYKLENDKLTSKQVVVSGIAGSSNHDGGRIAFGPDGYLYIATGDAENPTSAQDKNLLNGKVLRVDTEGNPAPDNPFGNAVYSMGHRNIQGIAWDKENNLWVTEHGPSGGQTGNDEVNLIKKGGNYGWPDIKGQQTKSGMETPVIESGTNDTWAPSGMAYYKNSLFFVGLRGQALYQAKIVLGNKLDLSAHFKNEYGRLRTVSMGPDNYFYLITNNTDGRGTPKSGDDKIIRINPEIFNY